MFPSKQDQVTWVGKKYTLTGIRDYFDYEYPPINDDGKLPHVVIRQASLIGTGLKVTLGVAAAVALLRNTSYPAGAQQCSLFQVIKDKQACAALSI